MYILCGNLFPGKWVGGEWVRLQGRMGLSGLVHKSPPSIYGYTYTHTYQAYGGVSSRRPHGRGSRAVTIALVGIYIINLLHFTLLTRIWVVWSWVSVWGLRFACPMPTAVDVYTRSRSAKPNAMPDDPATGTAITKTLEPSQPGLEHLFKTSCLCFLFIHYYYYYYYYCSINTNRQSDIPTFTWRCTYIHTILVYICTILYCIYMDFLPCIQRYQSPVGIDSMRI